MDQYGHIWIQEIFNMYIEDKTKTYYLSWFQSFILITESLWDTGSVGGGSH